jgi:hypothetical protein
MVLMMMTRSRRRRRRMRTMVMLMMMIQSNLRLPLFSLKIAKRNRKVIRNLVSDYLSILQNKKHYVKPMLE